MRTGQEGITVEVSAFLSPLVSSMEHQEIASELSDEEHLNVDVHFISSLPVMQRPVCKAWADKRHVQIVWAVR